jgi:hypothetical protein
MLRPTARFTEQSHGTGGDVAHLFGQRNARPGCERGTIRSRD